MAGNNIKIGANTSEFKKSIMDMANFAKKTLGKSPLSLFDASTKKMLSGELQKSLSAIETKIGRLKTLQQGYAQQIKASAGNTEAEAKAKERMINSTKKLLAVEKERASLSEVLGGGGGVGFGGGLGKGLSKIPQVGALSGLGGMGMAGMAGLGIGTLGAVGLLYGMSRMKAGYDKFHSGIGSRISLRGRGVRDLDIDSGLSGDFSKVGMDAEAVRQARLQSMDAFGSAGSTQGSILKRAQFARNFGVDLSSLQSMGGGMRAQVGTKGAERDMFKLQASLIASGVKDAVGPYLETAATMLTDIRQQGLVNSSEVLGLMATMTKSGNSPEEAAKRITGFQHAVQGSSGEANAFFQMAFAKAGIGGRSIGGTQAAIQSGGIFGVNLGDYKNLTSEHRKMLTQLGIAGPGTGTKERLGAILNLADQYGGGGKTKEGALMQGRFMMDKLGAKSPTEALDMLDQIRSAQKSNDPLVMQNLEKKLKSQTATPEEKMLKNLEDINKSTEGTVQALDTLRDIQLETMGKQVAPAAMQINKTLLHVDEIISGIYEGLAHFIPGMETAKTKMNNALEGRSRLSDSQIEEATATGQQPIVRSKLYGNKMKVEKELSQAKSQREYDRHLGSKELDAVDQGRINQLEGLLANLNSSFQRIIDVNKEHLAVAKENAKNVKKWSAKPKSVIPAKGHKTR